jgi:hypothetical protein
MTLLDALTTVSDPRRRQGRRYPLPEFLAMILMAMLSGHHGYRQIERFLRTHEADLRRHVGWSRRAMPSNVTIRAVLIALDYDSLKMAFCSWASQHVDLNELLSAARASALPLSSEYPPSHLDLIAFGERSGFESRRRHPRSRHRGSFARPRAPIADLAHTLGLPTPA